MLGWKGFFYVKGIEGVTVRGSVDNLQAIFKSAMILVGYTLVFLGVAIVYFKRKNILS
jgi:ABC-type transport system involved in multi-copper enzyme maturation permease subunit